MANDRTQPRAIALVAQQPAQGRHGLPAAVRAAAHSAAAWDDQPIFTMTEDQAAKISAAIENARKDLAGLFLPTDPREVMQFMARLGTRRDFHLPPAADLLADAMAVSTKLPADLFHLACQRLWAEFAYRRLPEPADFTEAVKDLLNTRIEARAKIARMEMALAARQALRVKVGAIRRH